MQKKLILVVEDNEICREILKNILESEYDVVEASNGAEALKTLKSSAEEISAILLDLMMPEVDGFQVLQIIKSEPRYAQIPVIVETSDSDQDVKHKALELGAVSYITKPFDATAILLSLANIIRINELIITISSQTDILTGLYERNAFFERVHQVLEYDRINMRDTRYILSCFDIDKFKVVNDLYGSENGDEVLKHIGTVLKDGFKDLGGICSRISGDNFAVFYPVTPIGLTEIDNIRYKASHIDGFPQPLVFSVGRYLIDAKTDLTPNAIYDRAIIAKATVKGRFDEHIALFDQYMLDDILAEQRIVSEMNDALADKQFEVWYQPQYNHDTGALVGAEALVRWRHPSRGLISPAVFIPIFEKNGFVYEIDKFVWEQSCIFLRMILDSGRRVVPISVNISRRDIYRSDLVQVIISLIKKYSLSPDLLRLEITESAFADSNDRIIDTVELFKEYGFTVEIDDFGSGYSSLNTLKDVPADVLKLDMRFLQGDRNSDKGGNIVASMVRMAKWLGMTVIAEGVETLQQANFLKSIGCSYIQGYIYSKPLPRLEYDRLLGSTQKEDRRMSLEKIKTYDVESFWTPESMDTLIFDSFVGGACICEFCKEKFSFLRVNEKFTKIVTKEKFSQEDVLKINFEDFFSPDDLSRMFQDIKKAIASGEEVVDVFEILMSHGKEKSVFIRSIMRVIANIDDRYMIYTIVEEITDQVEAQRKQNDLAIKLEAVLNNIEYGVSILSLIKKNTVILELANERYFEQRGYTQTQLYRELPNALELIADNDKARLVYEIEQGYKNNIPFTTNYSIKKRDNSIVTIESNISFAYLTEYKKTIMICISKDISRQKEFERKERELTTQLKMVMDNIGSGVCAAYVKDSQIKLFFTNEQFYKLRGYTKEQYCDQVKSCYDIVYEDDRALLRNTIENMKHGDKPFTIEYRIKLRSGGLCWIRNTISVTDFTIDGAFIQLSVFNDVTKDHETSQRLKDFTVQQESLVTTLNSFLEETPGAFARIHIYPDGKAVTDYASRRFANLLGYSLDEILQYSSKSALWGIHPEDLDFVKEIINSTIANQKGIDFLYRHQKKDGSYVRFSVKTKLNSSNDGSLYMNLYYNLA